MVKRIVKIGNSQGIIFDSTLLDLANIAPGDELNITLHESGSILLTPIREAIEPKTAAATAKRLIRKNSELFKRLS